MLKPKFVRNITLCILCLNISACEEVRPVQANVPNSANSITAVHPKSYRVAYQRFYDRAMRGDSVAQNNLGQMYSDGRGVERDNAEAIKWFTLAARQGNSDAEINLGVAYLFGRGVAANKKTACKYFWKARTQGNPASSEFLSKYCHLNIG